MSADQINQINQINHINPQTLINTPWMDLLFQNLPIIFMMIMGLSMLIYVILDGYDLGIGILLKSKKTRQAHGDLMIATIAPFWDANETWLVLGVGILLTCFPQAHGVILSQLYLPTAIMLLGLILRGAAFDFRVKAKSQWRNLWDAAFSGGSFIASGAQGWMLGAYILGFDHTQGYYYYFCALISICLIFTYRLLGACWLIIKSVDDVQQKAIVWARQSVIWLALGILAISLATPMISQQVFDKWFSLPNFILLLPIPFLTIILLALLIFQLTQAQNQIKLGIKLKKSQEVLPFMLSILVLMLAFYGLAYSIFPYIVPFKMDIWQAAASQEALEMIFYGAAIVVPMILAYTIYSYSIFKGKMTEIY
jgi:cytochrome bd ubiquinol oxidase subunit II